MLLSVVGEKGPVLIDSPSALHALLWFAEESVNSSGIVAQSEYVTEVSSGSEPSGQTVHFFCEASK